MPQLRTILALSLGGNVLLAIMVVPAWRSASHQVPVPSASIAIPTEFGSSPQWSELYSPDRAQFRKNLEAAGLPFATIADILRAERKIRVSKEQEHQPDAVADFSLKNFWDTIPAKFHAQHSNPTEQYLGFLTEAKRTAAEKILKDYTEMERELLRVFMKSGDAAAGADFLAKRTVLDREKQRDLTAILGPQGMELFELWNSSLAHSLRKDLNGFNPTEAEFRLIYLASRNYESDMSGLSGPDMFKKRQIADQAKQESLLAALGEERYHDYARTESTEYQDLVAIGERFQLPVSTASRLFDLRGAMSKESWRIAGETTIPADVRSEQLKALAERTEAQFFEVAGPKAGPQLQGLVSEWTKPLREGTAILYERKNTSYFQVVPSSKSSTK